MTTKNTTNDFELEIDSRELTSVELLEIKDFIRRDKEKNSTNANVLKPFKNRKLSKSSKV
ncbi:MAG: hypothetical protein EBQ94_04470 [Flavobacteriales bacterium]|nr:hypothetical protein [Flavobacteriales bacterium]